ncbi:MULTISPECIES: phosphomethylpyrimidine synthase ThiC [Pyrobaculum]|uniref:Phosphomethylpyrimidine synthase n=2 Tax=Pyrobaculum aerophilum TaxID=13773 RepID=THIC_PYRAE|nr:phosphomethylpyrimidine synthase ThiC [Pyrobaculum aerophilum]Q8ZZC0.1 RecName: Full=Phosphomethylpyrimidine synthase; AltName: Full=Hydroxymethylpyrimidine phosphate synthase; Short=HMP-P synthase; Short=HMP-phosphate synthase; Short=HMPP synthase; AltName: Full=Thiamine biosynthesis protein ThiC [Pyrobaculum aerophilum str. IM2]AAL62721.1 thiamine biosynthesis protein (thiC) [Pyrobaculum aerophilum str. IM2]MCX8136661.1 phosphomethylpyrimidine synthase ThiC [Pyrobaculum aerophilum]HII46923
MDNTIIRRAREGRIDDEMRKIAEAEGVSPEKLRDRIAKGQVVYIRNVKWPSEKVVAIGKGLSTKINVNLGTSTEVVDLDSELKKVEVANKWGDTLMDLSVGGDLDAIRRAVISKSKLPVGTVPVYQAFIEAFNKRSGGAYFTIDDLFNTIERQLKDGVAFMTIHAAVTKEAAIRVLKSDRVIPVVSRGGDMIIGWMLHNDAENPYLTHWDYLLELFAQYDAVISIGDALRPGAVADAHDEFHVGELVEAARLAKRAIKAGVQVMIEGPGHVPLNDVIWTIKLEKRLTGGVPYYVLGPLPTDVAAPYDHIASAVGAALAAAAGADLLCYITPAEHLSLPTVEQVEQGAIAYRIAAHIGDVVKLGRKARRWDDEVSYYRGRLMWDEMIKRLVDPERAYKVYTQYGPPKVKGCTMCGGYCPMNMVIQQARRLK